jgi:hypothetical protein
MGLAFLARQAALAADFYLKETKSRQRVSGLTTDLPYNCYAFLRKASVNARPTRTAARQFAFSQQLPNDYSIAKASPIQSRSLITKCTRSSKAGLPTPR